MATLDDKLLGEKLHYYCSSSEDEGGAGDSGDEGAESGDEVGPAADPGPGPGAPPADAWTGSSTNTGPKGVIKDWQRYKQLEAETRASHSLEKMQLAKKLTLTCRSNLDDDKEKAEEQKLEEELGMLEDDDVLREFIERRMREMAGGPGRPQFGHLIALATSEQFLDAVDLEHKDVTVIVHLYDERTPSCRTMNDCLATVSQQQPLYKFCKLRATTAGVSKQFSESGVPALIVYKGGAVIGNFVRLEDELGDDFCASDLENFLIEHGLLADRSCAPACIRTQSRDSDDSD